MVKFIKLITLFVTFPIVLVGCNEGEPLEQVEPDEKVGQEEQIDDNSQTDEEVIQVAVSFIEELSNEEYEQATVKFDETMQEQLGAEDLGKLWVSLEEQLGAFSDYEYDRTESVDGYEVVLVTGIFQDVEVMFQVTVDENYEVAGFYIH